MAKIHEQYTSQQHLQSRISSAYGYAVQGVPLSEFEAGEGIIVLTQKGEPVMSGAIEDIGLDDTEEVMGVMVGDDWYFEDTYIYRRL